MSASARQDLAIMVVFLLLGGVLLLTVAPFELGSIRLAGVSLLWWYGVVAAPVAAVTVTIAAFSWRPSEGVGTTATPSEGEDTRADATPRAASEQH